MATYVVSDLHGQYRIFKQGLKDIDLKDDDFLYVIGDVIDRGNDGIKILEYIRRHKNMDLLLGNHEHMMLNSVDPCGGEECRGIDTELWIYLNGGLQTYEKYLDLTPRSRKRLFTWLNNRYVVKLIEVNGKRFCLTHSYYMEKCADKRCSELEYDDAWEIVWKSMFREDRSTRTDNIYKDLPYTFITGHVPVHKARRDYGAEDDFNRLETFSVGNLIDIDGGCAYLCRFGMDCGALFLRLDDMKVFPVRMIPEDIPLRDEMMF